MSLSFRHRRLHPNKNIPHEYWEIIADNLSKAGWSWGRVATVDSNGRTIFVADELVTIDAILS
jgi:hypothetical protein